MTEHPNVTRTREYLDTFARRDLQGLRPFFSDDVVWHVAGDHDLSGDYVGKDELTGYLEFWAMPDDQDRVDEFWS
ncbi:MAG: SnoaL-like domain [Actinomycetota bacterium]|jgi:ketosteroid isomerase-like protein|nr:SnoaL-like domain [Actinomycetota bacterium]